MSFPGRPPMVPGMPVGPPPGIQMSYMGLGAPPPLMSAIVPPHMIGPPPMGPGMAPAPQTVRTGYRPPMTMGQNAMGRSPVFSKRVAETGAGPAVTVFVGNITERAPDAMIRHILAACGQVVSWKRVQGASGRAPAFGFCEYGSPDAGLRAVRLLHDLDLGAKKLVVKVDAKTKVVLDEFKDDRRRKLGMYGQKGGGGSPLQDEKPDEEDNMDYMDDDMKGADQSAMDRIFAVIQDYEPDMKNYNPPNAEKERKVKTQEKLMKLGSGLDGNTGGDLTPNFDDGEMEEGKRDLITREIGKFREIMKKQEEEKEAERRRKEAKEKERREKDGVPRSPPEHRRRRERSPGSPMSPRRSRSRSRSPPPLPRSRHSVSPPPLPSSRSSRPQPPSRSPSPESTYSNKLRAKGRDWRRSHSRSRERDEPMAKRSEREIQKERELEEEAKERKKQDRKAREKEAAYQERLRNWEGRERRKAKEHAKEREKERRTQEQQAREACRIKEFLEDYDDDRDDNKFYKGRELAKKLAAREAEHEGDMRDRQREREELEEIRSKIYSDKACDNPSAEFERIREERELQYKPKFLVRIETKLAPPPPSISESGSRPASPPPQSTSNGGSNLSAPPAPSPWRPPPTEDSGSALASPPIQSQHPAEPALAEDDSQLSAVSQASMPPMDDSVSPAASRGFSGWRSPHPPEPPAPASPPPAAAAASTAGGVSIPVRDKKRKLEIREVFNTEDDDEGSLGPSGRKRKPLVPLDYGEDKGAKKKDGAPGDSKASQEEKRKHIKSLIDKIPTDKEALFGFPIDWEAVDQTLMERRIRPWINKKIIEYIGEPEPTLVDFICSKVLVGSPPQGILDDVQMVLDDEAEVFVVKMWRLLIYEIEAKKLGLVK